MTKKASSERIRREAKKRETENQRKQERRNRLIIVAAVLAGVVIVSAVVYLLLFNEDDDPCGDDEPRALTEIPPEERDSYFSAYPELVTDPSKEYEACIRTEKGDIRLKLFAEQSPLAVNSFVFLARQGFYDGTTFHRVIEDFMAQAGDPTGTGTGGPGYAFEDEVSNGLIFDRAGLLAMANSGQPVTNGSQFFITYNETPWLNGRHTIFGEVIEGQDILNELNLIQPDPTGRSPSAGDLIERINIIER